jgi:hypothetical protein
MLKLTRWTIAHRRFVVAAWVVLAVGVLAVSQTIGKRDVNNFSLPNTAWGAKITSRSGIG